MDEQVDLQRQFDDKGFIVTATGVDNDLCDQLHQSLVSFAAAMKNLVSFKYGPNANSIAISTVNIQNHFLQFVGINGFYRYYMNLGLAKSLLENPAGLLRDLEFGYGTSTKQVSKNSRIPSKILLPTIETMAPTLQAAPELLVATGYPEASILNPSVVSSIRIGFTYYDLHARVNGLKRYKHKHEHNSGLDIFLKLDSSESEVLVGDAEKDPNVVLQGRGDNVVMDGKRQLVHCPVVDGNPRSSMIAFVPASLRSEYLRNHGIGPYVSLDRPLR